MIKESLTVVIVSPPPAPKFSVNATYFPSFYSSGAAHMASTSPDAMCRILGPVLTVESIYLF